MWRKDNYAFFRDRLSHEPKESLLLDVGCGKEQFRDLTHAFQVTAVDFEDFGGNIVMDLTKDWVLPSDKFDIVYASNVLEHILKPEKFLSEAYRVLKPGGKIIGTVPFLIVTHQQPFDYYRYTHYALKKLLGSFKNVEIVALTSPHEEMWNLARKIYVENPGIKKKPLYHAIRLLKETFKIEPTLDFCLGYGFKASK